jgi:hypothetical protein
VQFNRDLNAIPLNVYDTEAGTLGAADVVLQGAVVGVVRGSVVVDPGLRKISFLKTGGPLAADTYTVTLRSASDGFVDTTGSQLDGDTNGAAGGNYSTNFVVAESSAIVVSIPDFARGFGQAVNVPATGTGIPLTLSNGLGLSGLDLELHYDPTLLDVSGFTLNAGVAARGGVAQLTFPSPGRAILTIDSTGSFGAAEGSLVIGTFTARVPDNAAYGGKQILDLTNPHVFENGPNLNEVPSIDDDSIHIAAFFGDTNGSGTYNSPDTTLVRRIIGQVITGLSAYQLADPILLADITLNGAIQSSDTTSIRRVIGQLPVANVPSLPIGLTPPAIAAADPRIFIPRTLTASPGSTVTVPVKLEVTEPAGITISGFEVVLEFDATKFTVGSSQLGDLFAGTDLSGTFTQPAAGKLIFTADSFVGSGHFDLGIIGDLFTVTFNVRSDAANGGSTLNLLAAFGTTATALFDNNLNDLMLVPMPTNGTGDTVDGLLTVTTGSDTTPPTVMSFARQTPSTSPTNQDTLVFRATFSEMVTGVDTVDFAVSGTTATVTAVNAVSGSNDSQYDVTISSGNLASLNGTVGLNLAAAQNITDASGNALLPGEPLTDETYVLDNTAPELTSFTRQTPSTSPTNADSLMFRATFNEAVTNVNTADFTVNGTTTATVTGVASVSASVYDVTVSGGNLAGFNGTVGLDLAAGQNITDASCNALLPGEPLTDETYVVDNTAPTSVMLSIAPASMMEAAGTSTVTTTLSAVSSLDVTVVLAFGGTATNVTDYTRSGTQIVIPAGSTTGTVTLTAVQDSLDETDETIVVDITSVTNDTESGTQQVTATIADDDPPPSVTLSVAPASMMEAAGTSTVTATLSAVSGLDVTVILAFDGTATNVTDYTRSGTQIVIPAGSTTGTVTLTAVQDSLDETDETIVVDITSVTNGSELGTQSVTTTITDNERPTNITLSANTVAENASGATIGAVTVTDPDANDTHTFTVSDTRFEIATGQLKLKAGQSLNFEVEPTIDLDITATDAGGLNLTKPFTITVTNVNEAPTAIILTNAEAQENTPGVVIGQLAVTDEDVGDAHILTVMHDDSELDGDLLRLKEGRSFRYDENDSTIIVPVKAVDAGGLSYTEQIAITVLAHPLPWQNEANAADANADGSVAPVDALVIINYINEKGTIQLPVPPPTAIVFYYDTNGDGFVSPVDVLIIINLLNATPLAGEGEFSLPPLPIQPPALIETPVASIYPTPRMQSSDSPFAETLLLADQATSRNDLQPAIAMQSARNVDRIDLENLMDELLDFPAAELDEIFAAWQTT